jgi:SAM-dependent methyltransferase
VGPSEQIGSSFDARAARYTNPVTDFMGERELRVIRTLVPEGSRVLDFGCGTGRTTIDLLRRGCTVTACDVSEGMLAICVARVAAERFECELTSDVSRMAGRTWPVVTAIGVLDYYPDPVPLLETIASYLAPGGRLVTTFPNALSPLAWAYWAGSRFTVPATPRTSRFVRAAARRAGLSVTAIAYAAPAIAPLGHTLVLSMVCR